jgi:hypothetical protein
MGATAEAPARPATYHLISLYRSHRIVLRPAEDVYAANGHRHTVDRGVMLAFEGYRCVASEQEMELLRELPCFTGIGAPREVWIEDEPGSPDQQAADIQTVRGALGSRPQAPVPPVTGWDQMTISQIREVLASGRVDPLRAGAWEVGHRNRKRVRVAIAQALLGDEEMGAERAALEAEPEIPDTFGGEGEEEVSDG